MPAEDQGPPETPFEELEVLVEQLDHPPSMREFTERARFNASSILSRFDDWDTALEAASDDVSDNDDSPADITEETLLEAIRNLADQRRHPPTAEEFTANTAYHSSAVIRRFGKWNTALREAGVGTPPPNLNPTAPTDAIGREKVYTDEQIIGAIQDVADELGRPPATHEFQARGGPSTPTVYERFDTWAEAIDAAGLDPGECPSFIKHTDEELLGELRRLAAELGHPPRTIDFNTHVEDCSADTVSTRFGSWEAALREAGLDPVEKPDRREEWPRYTRRQLIEELQRVAEIVGHPPKTTEFYQHGDPVPATIRYHFGTWKRALKAATLDPNEKPDHSRFYSDEKVVSEVQQLAEMLGHPPRSREIDEQTDITCSAITGRYGSLDAALEAMGLDPNQKPDDRESDSDV